MNVKIGGSPESWGIVSPDDPDRTKWNDFLDEVAEAGYKWIELGPYGYLPTNPNTLRSELDGRGLNLTAAGLMSHLENTDAWEDLEEQVLRSGELIASLGAKFFLIVDGFYTDFSTGEQFLPTKLDEDSWKQLIETIHKIAELMLDKLGLRLIFHPCADTHVQYEDQIEKFLAQTDPDKISLCFDIGHHAYRGGDPVRFMRDHHKRIPYLHLKSVYGELCKKIESQQIPFGEAVRMGVMTEPALGTVDFKGFLNVLQEIDYNGFGIVEQDMHKPPIHEPPKIAKRTREYLRDIGMG